MYCCAVVIFQQYNYRVEDKFDIKFISIIFIYKIICTGSVYNFVDVTIAIQIMDERPLA